MHDRSSVSRWLPAVFGLFVGGMAAMWAYNVGFAHGLAQQLPAAVAGVPPWGYYRPWGAGPFFPLFFLAFWFLAFRFALRGGPWRRGWVGHHRGGNGVPPQFEEWHRRAHERDTQAVPPPRS